MIELLIAAGLAIIVSGICSLFEAVLYSVPTSHLKAMEQAGDSSGRILVKMQHNVEGPIAAILSLNTIAHTAGATVAGSAAATVFGYHCLGYFSALFTLAVLILSEIIPKTAGVIYGKGLVHMVAYPLRGLVWVMTPAIWLSSLITRLIARGKTEEAITAEEIRLMARSALRTGEIKPYQEQTIRRILALENKMVKNVMTPRTVIFSFSQHLTLEEASRIPTKWEHSRFPVYDRDVEDIVGIVLTKEFFCALAEGKKDMHLRELMRPVHFAAETAGLNRVLMEFLESREHLFVVLDEYGGISGLISLEDVLEEILGSEIVDESDEVPDKRELAKAVTTS
ncbi:MAG: hemolysin family protein [Thermodesulfobacteriota bacterium]|nr:hemolysin family protein [Thermodesulfobacteriota bacterium]